jgi:ribosomal-protein-alanine N-acetyltransferase
MSYAIREMQERDLAQVVEIDKQAFPTQWPHPTCSSLKQELRNHLAHYQVAFKERTDEPLPPCGTHDEGFWQRFPLTRVFTPETSGSAVPNFSGDYVLGYAGLWVILEEAHLTSIAVRDSYRRKGIGESILISVIEMASQMNAKIVTLEVRISNKSAQTLYERYMFKTVGLRRRYYSDNGEDAYVMNTEAVASASYQSAFQRLKADHEARFPGLFQYATGTRR